MGTFPSNAFGLRDVYGNANEWTEDCYNASYVGAPSDGAALTAGDCEKRVLRGGSWDTNVRGDVRSANRYGLGTDNRFNFVGFRVARTLPTNRWSR